jgi:hypothetical protein
MTAYPLAAASLATTLLAGCATTQLGAQYVDPQFPRQSLRGAAVLVVCDAAEPAYRLLCEEKFSARLADLGARALTDPSLARQVPPNEEVPQAYLSAAQTAGARAVLNVKLAPDYAQPNPLSSFSIGIGGWSGSGGYYHGGSGVGGGVGVSVPVGAAGATTGLAALATLADVPGGRVIWTAKATTPAADAAAQLDSLAKVLGEAVKQQGIF